MVHKLIALVAMWAGVNALGAMAFAQESSFLLESVTAKGTALKSATVQEIAGLRTGASIDSFGRSGGNAEEINGYRGFQ